MDYQREQEMELEALQSIYPDEFEQMDPRRFSLLIRSSEEDAVDDGDDDEAVDSTRAAVTLTVTYPLTYPDTEPDLELSELRGFDAEEEESLLYDLTTLAKSVCTESLGMPMIFSVSSSLKERLDEVVAKRRDSKLEAEREHKRKLEEKENAKFIGTAVTVEAFLKWKKAFDAEMQAKNPTLVSTGKPSGRSMFEKDSTLAASDMKYIEEGEVTVDLALFEREMGALGIEDDAEEQSNVDFTNME